MLTNCVSQLVTASMLGTKKKMYSESNDSLIHEKEVVNIKGVLNAVKCHLVKDWRSHHQSLFSSMMHHKFVV